MSRTEISHIRKRDGTIVPFNPDKIARAVSRAFLATGTADGEASTRLARRVADVLQKRTGRRVPGVETVQDIVEEVLMTGGYPDVARSYVLYRQQRAEVRRLKGVIGVRDDLKLGVNAIKVLERRYLLKDEAGKVIEIPVELFRRVARAVAAAKKKFAPPVDPDIEPAFFEMMRNLEFVPNTPTLMNAGISIGQLSACFVLPVEDSVVSIFDTLKNMALIHQSGGGTGFTFTHLRPRGDMVRSTSGVASGPLSFMSIFDAATGVMKQGGKRRGANMGILNADHPDVPDFVEAKENGTSLANFNISVGASDAFMAAVSSGRSWPLVNPRTGKTVRTIDARQLFHRIISGAWKSGDPGMIFLDEINRYNPTPRLGRMEATNPCGELPLLPYESCNLGSINLARVISKGRVNWPRLERLVTLAVRFLDDAIEVNRFPLGVVEKITRHGNRKIGLGVMGFADALIELGIPYNSEAALETAEGLMRFISEKARAASEDLAAVRGVFPNYAGSVYDRPGGPRLRNATVLSIAPTGTISIIAGCSSGIEPLFALAFVRNVMEGTRMLEVNPLFEQTARERGFYSPELIEEVARRGTLREMTHLPEDVRRLFVTDWDITPEWHVRMQAVFQKYTDNSVSKTVNLPAEATPEDIWRIYTLAHELKCKGITIYRYGSKARQVLTLAGREPEAGAEAAPYLTAESEYAGGCPHGTCPF